MTSKMPYFGPSGADCEAASCGYETSDGSTTMTTFQRWEVTCDDGKQIPLYLPVPGNCVPNSNIPTFVLREAPPMYATHRPPMQAHAQKEPLLVYQHVPLMSQPPMRHANPKYKSGARGASRALANNSRPACCSPGLAFRPHAPYYAPPRVPSHNVGVLAHSQYYASPDIRNLLPPDNGTGQTCHPLNLTTTAAAPRPAVDPFGRPQPPPYSVGLSHCVRAWYPAPNPFGLPLSNPQMTSNAVPLIGTVASRALDIRPPDTSSSLQLLRNQENIQCGSEKPSSNFELENVCCSTSVKDKPRPPAASLPEETVPKENESAIQEDRRQQNCGPARTLSPVPSNGCSLQSPQPPATVTTNVTTTSTASSASPVVTVANLVTKPACSSALVPRVAARAPIVINECRTEDGTEDESAIQKDRQQQNSGPAHTLSPVPSNGCLLQSPQPPATVTTNVTTVTTTSTASSASPVVTVTNLVAKPACSSALVPRVVARAPIVINECRMEDGTVYTVLTYDPEATDQNESVDCDLAEAPQMRVVDAAPSSMETPLPPPVHTAITVAPNVSKTVQMATWRKAFTFYSANSTIGAKACHSNCHVTSSTREPRSSAVVVESLHNFSSVLPSAAEKRHSARASATLSSTVSVNSQVTCVPHPPVLAVSDLALSAVPNASPGSSRVVGQLPDSVTVPTLGETSQAETRAAVAVSKSPYVVAPVQVTSSPCGDACEPAPTSGTIRESPCVVSSVSGVPSSPVRAKQGNVLRVNADEVTATPLPSHQVRNEDLEQLQQSANLQTDFGLKTTDDVLQEMAVPKNREMLLAVNESFRSGTVPFCPIIKMERAVIRNMSTFTMRSADLDCTAPEDPSSGRVEKDSLDSTPWSCAASEKEQPVCNVKTESAEEVPELLPANDTVDSKVMRLTIEPRQDLPVFKDCSVVVDRLHSPRLKTGPIDLQAVTKQDLSIGTTGKRGESAPENPFGTKRVCVGQNLCWRSCRIASKMVLCEEVEEDGNCERKATKVYNKRCMCCN